MITEAHVITFGKYKGTKLGDIPAGYLQYLAKQEWFIEYIELNDYIVRNAGVIQRRAIEEKKELFRNKKESE